MDTHSRNKKHQAEAASDNAGPVPETRPDLTGIIWQKESGKRTSRFFLADENATENFERWRLTGMYIVSAVTWVPARP